MTREDGAAEDDSCNYETSESPVRTTASKFAANHLSSQEPLFVAWEGCTAEHYAWSFETSHR